MSLNSEESKNALSASIGKIITTLNLTNDYVGSLHFTLEDGSRLMLIDLNKSCCEHRYMRTDDDLKDYIGAKLLRVEIRYAPSTLVDGEEHEVAFLAVQTDRGEFVVSSHNEHNGYYGGFYIQAELVKEDE